MRASRECSSQGLGIFITGLPAAGKSSLSREIVARHEARTGRPMSVLDGDEVRKMLSSELNFSREHRDLNVARLGFVASEIMRHGGACVIAAIAPYERARNEAIERMRAFGLVALVHVSTALATCEARDPKGLYAMARAGKIANFTGIDDPYETPCSPDATLDLGSLTLVESCEHLEARIDAMRRSQIQRRLMALDKAGVLLAIPE